MSSSLSPIGCARSFRDKGVIVPAGSLALIASAGVAFGITGWSSALYARAQARRYRRAAQDAAQRELSFVAAARRLSDASRDSIVAVREEIDRAVRGLEPAIDSVLFFEEVDAHLTCVAASGARATYFNGSGFALDDEGSILVSALRAGHRVTSADGSAVKLLHPGDAFGAAIPLVLDAGRRCVLYVASARVAPATVADGIVRLIDQATPAYRIALERADDRTSARYDGLTGLLSARAFRTQLAQLTEAVRHRPGGRYALLFIDTDRFKQWNDHYGHASGDALLRELAQLLRAALADPADIAARNGGDEFCIIFAGCEKSAAVERAERLRAAIATADFSPLHPHGVRANVRISASIGIACFPMDARSSNAILEKADEAMYHSKKTGRDAVAYFSVDGTLVRAGAERLLPAESDRRLDRR